MKKLTYIIVLLLSFNSFSQEVDIKDTVRYWVQDGDSLLGGYSNNQANSLEKLINHKLLHKNSDPKIIILGNITVDFKKLSAPKIDSSDYSAPVIDKIIVNDNVYLVYIDQDETKKEPSSYEVNINDKQFYSNVKIDHEFLVTLDTTKTNIIKVKPIYEVTNNKLISNQLTINN